MSQSRVLPAFDPSVDGTMFDPTINSSGGALIFFNFSVFEGKVTFPDGDVKVVPAWHWRCIHWAGGLNGPATWNVLVVPNTANPPSQTMLIEAYLGLTDLPPEDMGSLPRQANVGNTVATSSGTSIQNDGNGPGTSIVEATPNDQGTSSVQDFNDGSGFRKILSAGTLRTVWNRVRGNATTGKAALQLGDSGDPTILTLFGQLAAALVTAGGLPNSVGMGQDPSTLGFPGGRLALRARGTPDTVVESDRGLFLSATGGNVVLAVNAIEDPAADMRFSASAAAKRIILDSAGDVFYQASQDASPTAGNAVTWGGTTQLPRVIFSATQPANPGGVTNALWINTGL